jgi:hypothetical protein
VPGPRRLETLDRLHADALRLARAPEEAVQARQRAQAVALGERVVELSELRQRTLGRADRGLQLAGEVALVAASAVELGVVGHAQSALVLSGRLPVRAERGGTGRGGGRVTQDRLAVARRLGVVGQTGEVGIGLLGERRQRSSVEVHAQVRRLGLEHAQPGQLVPERHRRPDVPHHAGRQALVEMRELIGRDRL